MTAYAAGGGMTPPPGLGWGGGMMGPGMMGWGQRWGGIAPPPGPGWVCPRMMGWGQPPYPDAKPITIDQAAEAVNRYIRAYDNDLILTEVMEFAWNFYAVIEEKSTGIYAMELIVNKYTGQVFPEPGPNMMWNTKYGMMARMGGGYRGAPSLYLPSADMPITPEQAQTLAQQSLNVYLPGVTTGDTKTFYGYYTLHTIKNGQIEGMLSVNGYTGDVWYHTWHGAFIRMIKFH
jgi:hypothetical protein